MPLAAVRIEPEPDVIPDWWNAEFHRRQLVICKRIIRILKRCGEQSSSNLQSSIGGYNALEYHYALTTLERQRLIRQTTRIERLKHGSEVTRKFTYYELTDGQ